MRLTARWLGLAILAVMLGACGAQSRVAPDPAGAGASALPPASSGAPAGAAGAGGRAAPTGQQAVPTPAAGVEGGASTGRPRAIDDEPSRDPQTVPTEAPDTEAPPVDDTAMAREVSAPCGRAATSEPLVPRDGEQCWSFPVHGVSSPTDTSAFEIVGGERYAEWYFAVPWPQGSVASRMRTQFDSEQAYYQTTFAVNGDFHAAGDVDRDVLGTTFGQDAVILGTGAAGGCDLDLPPDVGLELPDDGLIMVQWHTYNFSGESQLDTSTVHICTVPRDSREHLAGITVLGTENLHADGRFGGFRGEAAFSGRCVNQRAQPVHVIGLAPRLRGFGIRSSSVIERASGQQVTLLDAPFDVDRQVSYALAPPAVVEPGEALTTTCFYNNTSDSSVSYGQSAHFEQCYHLAVAYPAIARADPTPLSLIAATNVCWE